LGTGSGGGWYLIDKESLDPDRPRISRQAKGKIANLMIVKE
jgi:hypothetical protein